MKLTGMEYYIAIKMILKVPNKVLYYLFFILNKEFSLKLLLFHFSIWREESRLWSQSL